MPGDLPVAEFIYWSCLLLPVYAYLGYPLMLSLLAPLFPMRRYGKAFPMDVSIVIAAHNEARHIEEKNCAPCWPRIIGPIHCESSSPATAPPTTRWPAHAR
nr:hypothetical protein GCM10020185_62010 [Pseudomonas brassicacearum subsp. brassicacearum]